LKEKGIQTCFELRKLSQKFLAQDLKLGPKTAKKIFEYCRGIDTRPWNPRPIRKSVSAQISWGVRMKTDSEVEDFLKHLSAKVVDRMLAMFKKTSGNKAKGTAAEEANVIRSFHGASLVSLKVWRAKKNANPNKRKGSLGHGQCDRLHRSLTRSFPTKDPEEVARNTIGLFKALKIEAEEVRGMGVILGNLHENKNSASSTSVRKLSTNQAKRRRTVLEPFRNTFNLSAALQASTLTKDIENLQTLSHKEMVDAIIDQLRKTKTEPEVLPFLGNKKACEAAAFCNGETCGSVHCFQKHMLDCTAQFLYEMCVSIDDDLVRIRCLIQAVKQIANCIWEKDSDLNKYWQSCCDQLKFQYREDVNVCSSSQISYSSSRNSDIIMNSSGIVGLGK